MIGTTLLSWLSTVLFLAATPAFAQGEPSGQTLVLVTARRTPPAAVSLLAESVARATGAPDARALGQRLDEVFPPATPQSWDPATLLAKIGLARDAYYGGQFAKAAPLFAAVQDDMRARIDRIGGEDRLATPIFASQMMYAIALVRTGRGADASTVIRDAHRLFPDRRPSITEFGPELMQLWASATTDSPGVMVRVEARRGERPCAVRRSGIPVGDSPAVLKGVPRGEIVVSAACAGMESRLRRVTVRDADQVIRIDVATDAAIETGAWVGLRWAGEREDARSAVSLAMALGASSVIVLRVDGGVVEGARLTIGGPGRLRPDAEGRARIDDAHEMTRLGDLLAGTQTDGEVTAAADPGPTRAAPGERDGTRGAVWWISGAAGVVAATAGTVFSAVGRSAAIDALEAESSTARADAEDTATTSLTLGSFLLPAGIGAALAGATLYFLPPDGPGALRGPVYAALVVGGAVLAGIGTTLVLSDDCEPFDPLCDAQGLERGPASAAAGFAILGVGAAAVATGIVLRLWEDG